MRNNSPKEKEIEKVIIQGIRWHGVYCQKVHSGSILKTSKDKFGREFMYRIKLADEGTPDILGCVPVKITQAMVGKVIGAFVAIEVKRSQKEIDQWHKQKDWRSQNQYAQHQTIRKAGGVVLLASSLNEVVDDILILKKNII